MERVVIPFHQPPHRSSAVLPLLPTIPVLPPQQSTFALTRSSAAHDLGTRLGLWENVLSCGHELENLARMVLYHNPHLETSPLLDGLLHSLTQLLDSLIFNFNQLKTEIPGEAGLPPTPNFARHLLSSTPPLRYPLAPLPARSNFPQPEATSLHYNSTYPSHVPHAEVGRSRHGDITPSALPSPSEILGLRTAAPRSPRSSSPPRSSPPRSPATSNHSSRQPIFEPINTPTTMKLSSDLESAAAERKKTKKRKRDSLEDENSKPSDTNKSAAEVIEIPDVEVENTAAPESNDASERKKRRKSVKTDSKKRSKKGKPGRKPLDKTNFMCFQCGTRDTPEWRKGPDGRNTLCNACGLRYAKRVKEENERDGVKTKLDFILNGRLV